MKTKEMNLEENARPEGVEVKVGAIRMNVLVMVFVVVLVVVGIVLFNYVWGDGSGYGAGYELGRSLRLYVVDLKGVFILLPCLLLYLLLQYGLLYWFSGKDRRAIRWNTDWKTMGFLLTKPLALKYYRIALLTPFMLMGLLPMIHGFSIGNMFIYFTGMFCVFCSTADCYYFWKLRSFNSNDRIVDGKESLSATIIKSSY